MEKTYPAGLMWFRRDLRASDNAALFHALKSCRHVHCAFVFDSTILDCLPRRDRRVEFIRESLVELDAQLRELAGREGAGLIVTHAAALHDIPRLARELQVQSVFANHDYEPQAVARDAHVFGELANAGIAFHTSKDQAVFERTELLTSIIALIPDNWLDGEPAFADNDQHRAAYVSYLLNRLAESRAFVEEALDARAKLV